MKKMGDVGTLREVFGTTLSKKIVKNVNRGFRNVVPT
jgi:hypothetical protein